MTTTARSIFFFLDNGANGGMALYHNIGEGKFEDATKLMLGIPIANLRAIELQLRG